jgi:methylmalonyl-CoA mutase
VLVFAGAAGANGYGISFDKASLGKILDGIRPEAGISIELQLSPEAKDAATDLAAIVKERGIAPDATDIRFGFDPLGAMATGSGAADWPAVAPHFSAFVKGFVDQGFRGPFAVADGRVVHNAGGSETQELAYVLAVAVSYLRALEADGMTLDAARRAIFFRLSADADQVLSIAKFRAARKLWARVESNLARVADPAAGAGGFEELTKQLCSGAWRIFQEIEKAGGIKSPNKHGPSRTNLWTARSRPSVKIRSLRPSFSKPLDFAELVRIS